MFAATYSALFAALTITSGESVLMSKAEMRALKLALGPPAVEERVRRLAEAEKGDRADAEGFL